MIVTLDPTKRCPAMDADGDRCARPRGHDGAHWCDDPCGELIPQDPQASRLHAAGVATSDRPGRTAKRRGQGWPKTS